jgi:ubiquinone/menaquinone biosynthesis C-methylase UbiE
VSLSADDARDTVARFSDRAADYVKYRPTYPAEAIDDLLAGLGPPAGLIVADVGAGTGISSRLVADRGSRVVAIEPGEGMRSAAAAHPRVRWLAARAERLALVAESVDLILCAQAFHWFDPAAVLPEFARVLRPDGRLAIMWNRRSTTDPLTQGYRRAILEVGGEITAERMPFDPTVVPAGGAFSELERHAFSNVQRLDL